MSRRPSRRSSAILERFDGFDGDDLGDVVAAGVDFTPQLLCASRDELSCVGVAVVHPDVYGVAAHTLLEECEPQAAVRLMNSSSDHSSRPHSHRRWW